MSVGACSRASRSHTLSHPTTQTDEILATARALLAAARPDIEERGLTLVGVSVTNLGDETQLELPFDARLGALDAVLDALRERFGPAAFTRGVLLARRNEYEVPLLPD